MGNRKLLIAAATLLVTQSAMAVMPFTIDGMAINTIFNSDKVWRSLSGPVEAIHYKGYKNNVATYTLTVNQDGPCLAVIEVTNTTPDELAPAWEVTSADYSACPGAKLVKP